jgi:2-dehydro-3-deoxy-D-pentonate aldolase
MKKLYGVVVPVVTPLDKNDKVDVKALTDLCEFLIKKGIHCLYPCGTTGEMVNLDVEERKIVIETVVKAAAGRVVVFAQVGCANLRDTIELAKYAEKVGADGVGVVTPIFFKQSDAALEEYYVKVAQSIPNLPVYLYAIPQCAVNDITPELAARIAARANNVIGIKYSYPNMSRIQQFMEINNGTFSVLCGPDELFFVTMCAGGDGTVSGTAMVIPDHYVGIYNKYQSGDYSGARMLQRKTNRVADILNSSNNIAHYKAALKELYGIDGGYMRCPGVDLTREQIDDTLAKLNSNDNLDAAKY